MKSGLARHAEKIFLVCAGLIPEGITAFRVQRRSGGPTQTLVTGRVHLIETQLFV